MEQATKDRLVANLVALPKMASAWLMSAAGAVGAVWFALPPEQQALLVAHSPLPPWAYPVAMAATGIVARVWPQFSTPPAAPVSPVPQQPERPSP